MAHNATVTAPPPGNLDSPIAPEIKAALDRECASTEPLSPPGLAWLEKVRRFASYNGRHTSDVARRRFGGRADEELAWMAKFLFASGKKHPERGASPIDAPCLGAAFFCADGAGAAADGAASALKDAEESLKTWLLTRPDNPAPRAVGDEFAYESGRWVAEAPVARSLVMFSPSPFSL